MPLSSQELQSKLWQAADILRGQIDAADYKNYIFSILFLKRLSDRFNEEVEVAVASGVPREVALQTGTSMRSSSLKKHDGPPSLQPP